MAGVGLGMGPLAGKSALPLGETALFGAAESCTVHLAQSKEGETPGARETWSVHVKGTWLPVCAP